jgi:hypothetical protein
MRDWPDLDQSQILGTCGTVESRRREGAGSGTTLAHLAPGLIEIRADDALLARHNALRAPMMRQLHARGGDPIVHAPLATHGRLSGASVFHPPLPADQTQLRTGVDDARAKPPTRRVGHAPEGCCATVTALLDRFLQHGHVMNCGPGAAHQGAHRLASGSDLAVELTGAGQGRIYDRLACRQNGRPQPVHRGERLGTLQLGATRLCRGIHQNHLGHLICGLEAVPQLAALRQFDQAHKFLVDRARASLGQLALDRAEWGTIGNISSV